MRTREVFYPTDEQMRLDLLKQWFIDKAKQGDLHHAYLFTGPNNKSKKEFILGIISQILGRDNLDMNPDALVLTSGEGKVSLGIEEIRQISGHLSHKSLYGGFKVVLIEEAERMTQAAQNALLKTLEEPSQGSVIILSASHHKLLLPTVVSRTFHFPLYIRREDVKLDYGSSLVSVLKKDTLGDRILWADKLSKELGGVGEHVELINSWMSEARLYMLRSKEGKDKKFWMNVLRKLMNLRRDFMDYSSPKMYLENFFINLLR